MKELATISQLYKPIQPTKSIQAKEIIYEEIRAKQLAQNFIHCYWQLKTDKQISQPFSYRVVSDGCIDIFLEQKNPNRSFVMGFYQKYTEFSIGTSFDYIGIRFLPSAFPLLFDISAKELSNKSQELKTVLPGLAEWISSSKIDKLTFQKSSDLLNEHFNTLINDKTFEIDSRFYEALIKIFQQKGYLDFKESLNTGLSPRQLRRIFNFYLGTTPKAFSNVVRFQNILNAKPSTRSLKENKIYYDLGFFDQAHFIKNFKTFYGVTPSEAFS